MGHLINPISFRLTRNRFWSLVLLYKTNIKNIDFFIKVICWFIKYVFIKFFFILPVFKINQFNLKYTVSMNDFFGYRSLLRSLVGIKKNKVLLKFLRNSFKLASNLFLNKILASITGFNKDVLFIRVSFLDLMFGLFISYKLFRPFFRRRFSFLVNFIRLFKKKKNVYKRFFFLFKNKFLSGSNYFFKLQKKKLINYKLKKFIKKQFFVLNNFKKRVLTKKKLSKSKKLSLIITSFRKKRWFKLLRNINFRNNFNKVISKIKTNTKSCNRKKKLLFFRFFKKKKKEFIKKRKKRKFSFYNDQQVLNSFQQFEVDSVVERAKSAVIRRNHYKSKLRKKRKKFFRQRAFLRFKKGKRFKIKKNRKMFSSLDKKFLRKFLRKEINFNQRLLCQYLIKTNVDLISLINYRKIKSKIFKTRYSVLIKFKIFNLIYLLIRRVVLRRLLVFYRLQYLQFNRWLKKFSFFSKKKLCNISNLIKIKKVVVVFFIAQGGFFMTAGLILQYVITKLRLGFKVGTVINHLRRSMKIVRGVRGYKICFAGRLTRYQIATYRWSKYEKLSLNTSSALLDYAFGVYQTRWGSVGVKFWLQRKTNLLFNRVSSNSNI